MHGTLDPRTSSGELSAATVQARLTRAAFVPPAMPPIDPCESLRGMRIALAGGGTGGHIVPGRHLLAHARGALADVLWFCTGRAVEERAFNGLERDLGACRLERVALRLEPEGGGAPSLSGLALRAWPALRTARQALRRHDSQVLIGLGGFTCLPAVLAARSLGIPVALIEINATRGKAVRWLAPFASRVFHAWRATLPTSGATERDVLTGPPLAPVYAQGRPNERDSARARAALGFDAARPLLVVLGGSQGAGALNQFIAANLDELTRQGLQILHQTGPGRLEQGGASRAGYVKSEYVLDVHQALSAATLVLCRGGASTLAEVAALRRPAWVVPYPHHADRHQERNARELAGGVQIVDEARLAAPFARELVQLALPGAAGELERRTQELERVFSLDAAARIAAALSQLAQTRTPRSKIAARA